MEHSRAGVRAGGREARVDRKPSPWSLEEERERVRSINNDMRSGETLPQGLESARGGERVLEKKNCAGARFIPQGYSDIKG